MATARGANYTHFRLNAEELDERLVESWETGVFRYRVAQCTPSREELYTAFGIPAKYLSDAHRPIPVEEDNVFAPRKVEVECVA